jgi:tRNA-Thr(GGU) m(6)t(6)A37 methyltransferase TsaA
MQLRPVALVHSCFKEKFAIPRQPLLAGSAKGELELLAPYDDPRSVDGLQSCSHVWLIFGFHGIQDHRWRPTVRPPRLGGNEHVGVFATRSTHRPNNMGLSVVALDGIVIEHGRARLLLSGIDLLDQTPVYDIKPYVPYADALDGAVNTLADQSPQMLAVRFAAPLDAFFTDYIDHSESHRRLYSGNELRQLIIEILQQDPAPAYHPRVAGREYGVQIVDVNVNWCYEALGIGCEDELEASIGIVVTAVRYLDSETLREGE